MRAFANIYPKSTVHSLVIPLNEIFDGTKSPTISVLLNLCSFAYKIASLKLSIVFSTVACSNSLPANTNLCTKLMCSLSYLHSIPVYLYQLFYSPYAYSIMSRDPKFIIVFSIYHILAYPSYLLVC